MFKEYATQISVGIFAFLWAGLALYYISMQTEHRTVTYDCRISEISPDFPIEVREACRQLRAKSGRI